MTEKTNFEDAPIQNPRVASEGCSVLLDINDGDRLVFSRLSSGAALKIGNKNYSLKPLIGCPYGSMFQVENGNDGGVLSRVVPSSAEDGDGLEKGTTDSMDEFRDNRALVDNNKAQSLTGDDIDAMRREGAKGDDIVEALIANSSTFEKKTVFSQEKYRLKKQKKYAPKVLMRRPFARSICEAYFKKYPARIGFLRIDTLSLLLSLGNVSANADVLVVDMIGGILTGAVAERLGGTGYVCNTYMGNSPYSMEIVRMFNFGDEICKRILRCSITDLHSHQNGNSEHVVQDMDISSTECRTKEQNHSNELLAQPLNSGEPTASIETPDFSGEKSASSGSKIPKAAKAGESASKETINLWKENGFSSLVVAAPDVDTWTIVKEVLPLLSTSAPFAIYHQYVQPLANCMHNLQLQKMAIGLQISEPWLREYQVLPSRTHPFMQMSAFGGYILSGTRIHQEKQ